MARLSGSPDRARSVRDRTGRTVAPLLQQLSLASSFGFRCTNTLLRRLSARGIFVFRADLHDQVAEAAAPEFVRDGIIARFRDGTSSAKALEALSLLLRNFHQAVELFDLGLGNRSFRHREPSIQQNGVSPLRDLELLGLGINAGEVIVDHATVCLSSRNSRNILPLIPQDLSLYPEIQEKHDHIQASFLAID